MTAFYAEIGIPMWSHADFDPKPVNKVIATEAREIRKIARRLVARRAISEPGQFPGRDTGALWRSITVKVNRKYSFAVIRPAKTAEMGSFHPYMLLRGTKPRLSKLAEGEGRGRSNRRRRGDRETALQERKASSAYRVAPREDYMQEALERRRGAARAAIAAAVQDSLVPRRNVR